MEPHRHDENCREVFALLSQYLDVELPVETCEQIRHHIAGCAPCIEFTESLRKTVDLCRKYKPAELPGPIGHEARAELLNAWLRMVAARSGEAPA